MECWGLEVSGQERILETSSVQKGGFIKARGQDLRQKELPWGCEEWLIIYFQAGRGLGIAKVSKEFKKQGFQDLEGLVAVKKRSFITV